MTRPARTEPPASGPKPDFEGRFTRWAAAASCTLFAALAWPAFEGRIYSGDDLLRFHLPIRSFYSRVLREGGAFDWFPGLLSGFYLTGEGQLGGYHPLHWLLYRFLDLSTAFNLEVWLNYPFLFGGMVLLLRRPGLRGQSSTRLPLFAALFGAMLFTFSGFSLLHIVHPNAVAVIGHLPWLLWCIDLEIRSRNERQRNLALAAIPLLTASQLLLGYPQYVWIVAFAEAFWLVLALLVLNERRRGPGVVLFRYGFAKVLGVCLGAIQLLPTWELLRSSTRSVSGAEFANMGSLHPLNTMQFVAPYVLDSRVLGGNTHEFGIYAGAAPFMLVAWLLSRQVGNRTLIHAVACFGAIAYLLALGNYGGLYSLQTMLPVVGTAFRLPARFVVLVYFAIAILAALAIAELPSATRAAAKPWHGSWLLFGVSVFVTAAVHRVAPAEALASPWLAAAGPALFALAAILISRARRNVAVGLPLLVLLAAADIGIYGMSQAVWAGARTLESIVSEIPPAPNDGMRAATLQPDRNGHFFGNTFVLSGWQLADGYVGLLPQRRLDLHSVAVLRLASVSRVRRIADSPPIEGLQPVDDFWDGVPEPLPRVRLVTRVVVSADPSRDAAAIPFEMLATTALVEHPLKIDGPAGDVALLADRPGMIDILVHAPKAQLLVIADRWHPGWEASVNGGQLAVLRVDGDFLGVAVPEGESRVELRFAPESLRWGKRITGAGILAWAFLVVLGVGRAGSTEHSPERFKIEGSNQGRGKA